MANPGYLRSTDGNDADDGSTWALANATLDAAMEIDAAAGDVIYISQVHDETIGGGTTSIVSPGTAANPCKIFCANDGAEPPTAAADTAVITTTSTSILTFQGSFYMRGINFVIGNSANTNRLSIAEGAGNATTLEACTITLASTSNSTKIDVTATGNNQQGVVVFRDVDLTFTGNAALRHINPGQGDFYWYGGVISRDANSITRLFYCAATAGRKYRADIFGLDMSAMNASMDIIDRSAGAGAVLLKMRGCKMPAGWSGALFNRTNIQPGDSAYLYNCDNADTNYRVWVETYPGTLRDETTIVRTGGASDGDTPIAWKMSTAATANPYVGELESLEIVRWNETVGSAITLTVEILHDSVTSLTDGEIWLDVQYLGTSGFPLSLFSDDKSRLPAAAANQAASTESWTTSGLTNPNKQKLSVTVTPQEKGYVVVKVMLGKPSYTVYVDPKLTVS